MSVYADQGTAAHTVLQTCLESIYALGMGMEAAVFSGQSITIPADERHHLCSPSGAKRWMTCALSVYFSQQYAEPLAPARSVTMTDDDCAAVQVALDYVAQRVEQLRAETKGPVKVKSERKVSLARWFGTEDMDGTTDVTIVANGVLEIVDYKHGAGVPVAETDPQLPLYGLAVLLEYARVGQDGRLAKVPFDRIRLTVCQPRCDKIEPRIRWIESDNPMAWALEWLGTLHDAYAEVQAALANPAEAIPVPSKDGCRWCPVGGAAANAGAPVCQAYMQSAMARVGVVLEDESLPQTREGMFAAASAFATRDDRLLSPGQIVGILDAREILTGALQAVEAHALALLESGNPPAELAAAYKLVEGRSNRRWLMDDAEIEKELKKIKFADPETGKQRGPKKGELFQEVLLGPAPLEKFFKARGLDGTRMRVFDRLVEKPRGKTTIAPLSDPRRPIEQKRVSAAEAFAGVDTQPQEAPK